jgi:hypothetical protein
MKTGEGKTLTSTMARLSHRALAARMDDHLGRHAG